jgi:hypothetical protein
LLAINPNGALLITWLLESSGLPGRFRVLAPKLSLQVPTFCTHKLASNTILKLINQRFEGDAREVLLNALFFSDPSILEEVLADQVHGVGLVQKILMSQAVEESDKVKIADRVRFCLSRLNVSNNVQSGPYKRLTDELSLLSSEESGVGHHNMGAYRSTKPPVSGMSLITNPSMLSDVHEQQPHTAHATSISTMGVNYFRGPTSASVYLGNHRNHPQTGFNQFTIVSRSPTMPNVHVQGQQFTPVQHLNSGQQLFMYTQPAIYYTNPYNSGYSAPPIARIQPPSAGTTSPSEFANVYFSQQNSTFSHLHSNVQGASMSSINPQTSSSLSTGRAFQSNGMSKGIFGTNSGLNFNVETPERESNTPTPTPTSSYHQ